MVVRRQSALKTAAASALGCALVACSGGSEEVGRIRVTPSEVAGIYQSGAERLELQANGTYVQDIVSDSQRLHHTGQWRILNHFLDGSEVLLVNAAALSPATPADNNPHPVFGDLEMYAHKRSGGVALARNEVADWYYERRK
jgi:hypothetical protein